MKYFEIRTRKGKLDDIALDDVAIHLEDMDGKLWWLGIYKKGTKKRLTFYIKSKSKITLEIVEQDLPVKFVEQE
ncbi:MAG: hypothetical protein ACRDFB_00780 [Rhabdochlamydiaceae bacterium]